MRGGQGPNNLLFGARKAKALAGIDETVERQDKEISESVFVKNVFKKALATVSSSDDYETAYQFLTSENQKHLEPIHDGKELVGAKLKLDHEHANSILNTKDQYEVIVFLNQEGLLHNEQGPAFANKAIMGQPNHFSKEIEEWWQNGQKHRLNDEPAVVSGNKQEWWVDGKRHRENGKPALTLKLGMLGNSSEWWKNGQRHREEGPAVINGSGKEYWIKGKKHRLDGPAVCSGRKGAIIWGDPKKIGDEMRYSRIEYWVDGQKYEEKEYKKAVKNYKKAHGMKTGFFG